MKHILFPLLIAFFGTLPALSVTAAITPYLQSESQAQTSGYGLSDGQYYSSNLITANLPNTSLQTQGSVASSDPPYGYDSASASASMLTQYGQFHSVLQADAYSGASGGYVASSAYGYGYWQDTVNVSSSTLALGTAVTITATIEVDRAVSDGGMVSPWWVNLYTNGVQFYDGYDNHNSADTYTVSYTTTVGGSFDVWQSLNAYASTQTVLNGSDSIGLDMGHSIHFYLDDQAGLTFTSQSGTDYSAAAVVPEPATLAMWGIGMVGCAITTFWRRRAKP